MLNSLKPGDIIKTSRNYGSPYRKIISVQTPNAYSIATIKKIYESSDSPLFNAMHTFVRFHDIHAERQPKLIDSYYICSKEEIELISNCPYKVGDLVVCKARFKMNYYSLFSVKEIYPNGYISVEMTFPQDNFVNHSSYDSLAILNQITHHTFFMSPSEKMLNELLMKNIGLNPFKAGEVVTHDVEFQNQHIITEISKNNVPNRYSKIRNIRIGNLGYYNMFLFASLFPDEEIII